MPSRGSQEDRVAPPPAWRERLEVERNRAPGAQADRRLAALERQTEADAPGILLPHLRRFASCHEEKVVLAVPVEVADGDIAHEPRLRDVDVGSLDEARPVALVHFAWIRERVQ